MNAGFEADHVSVQYYDGDYPSETHSVFPENFDQTTRYQGVAHDVELYRSLAARAGGEILELCCGTGRVAIPLAAAGHRVTAVDVSAGMLGQFRANLERLDANVAGNLTLVEQDATRLALTKRDFRLAIIAFNSLLCIADQAGQQRALSSIAQHLGRDGRLVVDIVNPLQLKISGDPVPKPFFTRRNPVTGNTYTRFAMVDAFDADNRQRLHGWYDEILPGGTVKRSMYSMHWRPIFRPELELMLATAGFAIEQVDGGHQGEPFTAQSPRMVVQARLLPR